MEQIDVEVGDMQMPHGPSMLGFAALTTPAPPSRSTTLTRTEHLSPQITILNRPGLTAEPLYWHHLQVQPGAGLLRLAIYVLARSMCNSY